MGDVVAFPYDAPPSWRLGMLPDGWSLARQLNSEDAVKNCQKLTVQGFEADYYQDGKTSLLVWENRGGILFFLRGTDVSQKLLTEMAEGIRVEHGTRLR